MSNDNSFILVVSGPSGSGKSSVVKKFLEDNNNFDISISHTTREKRVNEIDGKNYNFTGRNVFTDMVKKGEFVEWAEVYGNMYGTSKKELERILASGKHVMLEIDVEGARNVKKIFDARVVAVFIIPESFIELKRRLSLRNTESEESILKRINAAKEEFESIEIYDYVIINKKDGLEESAKELLSVCHSEIMKTGRFWSYYKDVFWR
jgi:guanylate kinase